MSETANTDATSAAKPDATSEATKQTDDQFPDGLNEPGKAALREQREARKAAEKLNGEFAKELTALRQEKADREKAKAEQDEADAVKKGEFETLAAKRKEEADAAKAEAKAHADKLTRANTALSAVLATRIAGLDALKDDELSAEFAAITDPLDQIDWFNKASTKRAMANAAEDKKVEEAKDGPKFPKSPKPKGDGKTEVKSLVNANTF